jgi:lipooligosaccharide transport system permease protein
MLTRTLPRFGSRRSVHIFERNLMVYRSQWLMLVPGFFEPLFYLLSVGIGLNKLVGNVPDGGRLISYATFVAPGMLVTSAMNGAVIDSIFNTFFRLKISRSYEAVLATPLDVTDVALGEVWWALARRHLRGVVHHMHGVARRRRQRVGGAVLASILTSFAFSCIGLAACAYMRSWQDFDLINLVQLPLFLFSATFFPISLYQSAALLRGLSLGQFQWIMILRGGYLFALAIFGLALPARRFRRIRVP